MKKKKNAEVTSIPVPEKEGATTMKIQIRSIDSQICKAKSKRMTAYENLINNCVTPIVIQHEIRTSDDAKTFSFRETSDYYTKGNRFERCPFHLKEMTCKYLLRV